MQVPTLKIDAPDEASENIETENTPKPKSSKGKLVCKLCCLQTVAISLLAIIILIVFAFREPEVEELIVKPDVGWVTLLHHHYTGKNPYNLGEVRTLGSGRFALLDTIEMYRCYGQFQFKLTYPETGEYAIWNQTTNPTMPGPVEAVGFQGIV